MINNDALEGKLFSVRYNDYEEVIHITGSWNDMMDKLLMVGYTEYIKMMCAKQKINDYIKFKTGNEKFEIEMVRLR